MAAQEPESELVTRAIAGDRVAIQQLLLSHTAAVSRFAAQRLPASVRDVIDPEDIVQQTFTEAFRRVASFRQQKEASFLSWLTAIAENKIMDAVKGLIDRAKKKMRTALGRLSIYE